MIRVFPLNDRYADIFGKMFADYYDELGCDEDAEHLVREYVLPDLIAGLLRADMIEEDGVPCGFCIYQQDEPGNDWNFKDGWGDIREIYVVMAKRRRGLGRFLLGTAEMRLKEAGAKNVYALPTSEAADFFAACGYELTDEVCPELECNVFSKPLGGCRCGKNMQ
ncbi:MAG TPA: GNAT family N-acetyltransferase [Candidatus Coproplasma avistercoris]|nr:GNAT family N-acetyltransferase [Candidatus Coproplasma avistercoris]